MTNKSELISAAILRHLMSGIEAEKAIDNVLGEGTVKQLAYEIYDAFQERIEERKKVGNE